MIQASAGSTCFFVPPRGRIRVGLLYVWWAQYQNQPCMVPIVEFHLSVRCYSRALEQHARCKDSRWLPRTIPPSISSTPSSKIRGNCVGRFGCGEFTKTTMKIWHFKFDVTLCKSWRYHEAKSYIGRVDASWDLRNYGITGWAIFTVWKKHVW